MIVKTLSDNEVQEIQFTESVIKSCETLLTTLSNKVAIEVTTNKLLDAMTQRSLWFSNVSTKYNITYNESNSWEVDFTSKEIRIV